MNLERLADVIAERLGIDPDDVRATLKRGRITVSIVLDEDDAAELLDELEACDQ